VSVNNNTEAKLFISNVAKTANKRSFGRFLEDTLKIAAKSFDLNTDKGTATVFLTNIEDANKAVQMNGTNF